MLTRDNVIPMINIGNTILVKFLDKPIQYIKLEVKSYPCVRFIVPHGTHYRYIFFVL